MDVKMKLKKLVLIKKNEETEKMRKSGEIALSITPCACENAQNFQFIQMVPFSAP